MQQIWRTIETTVENYARTIAPDLLTRVQRHEGGGVDAFSSFRIDGSS